MYKDKILSVENLESFNFEETKKNVISYFKTLEKLEWEYAKIRAKKGLTYNYDLSAEYQKQPYSPINKDNFNLSAKEHKEEQLKKYISTYYWATSILSNKEELYIKEYFVNHKYQDELVELFGIDNPDSYEYRRLRRSAVFKFADFLDLVVRNEGKNEEKIFS